MKHVFRLITALIFLLLLGSISHADEFRGLYVDAFHPGFKNHDEVTQMVNAAKAANFNALIVQVRKRGDAYYNSHIEPKASDIAADYDPLADIITQAHALGMEVHAWLSVYEVSNEQYTNLSSQHIAEAHPDWLMSDTTGRITFANGRIFVDPGAPEVQDHFLTIVADILENYNVDGINLDNCRYPTASFGYNPISVARFNQASGKSGIPSPTDKQWIQWRSAQVTALVGRTNEKIAALKPHVALSVSVMTHSPVEAAAWFLQEWDVWTKQGLVDFLIPMLYIAEDTMPEKASALLQHAYQRHIYVGLGGYRISSETAKKEINSCRAAGAKGMVFYSYHTMGPNSLEETYTRLSDLGSDRFARPAAIPTKPWKQSR